MYYVERENDPLILYSKNFKIEEKYLNKKISVDEARAIESDWLYYGNFHMGPHQSLIDRSGNMPMHVEYKNLHPFPDLSITKIKTYQECCDERAIELIEYSKSTGRKIRVMWSGGLDSTCVMCSFLKNGIDLEQLEVIFSFDSIVEYPWFYHNVIKKRNINHKWFYKNQKSKDYLAQENDKSPIIVLGEPNDDFFLGGFALTMIEKDMSLKNEPFEKIISKRAFNFIRPAIDKYPTKVKTFEEYGNFYMFSFMTQWCMTRFCVSKQFNIIGFYNTEDFQRWALFTEEPKILEDNIYTYKYPVRKVIYDYTKDEEYFLTKQKKPSSFAPNHGYSWHDKGSVFLSQEGYFYGRKTIDENYHKTLNDTVRI